MKRWLKMTRIFLGCLFHVKNYSWYAPWLTDEWLCADGERKEESEANK